MYGSAGAAIHGRPITAYWRCLQSRHPVSVTNRSGKSVNTQNWSNS